MPFRISSGVAKYIFFLEGYNILSIALISLLFREKIFVPFGTDEPCIDSIIIADPINMVDFIENDFIHLRSNPVSTMAVIEFNDVVRNQTLSLSDVSGRLLQTYPVISTTTITIGTGDLLPGIYFLSLSNGAVIKMIKN